MVSTDDSWNRLTENRNCEWVQSTSLALAWKVF